VEFLTIDDFDFKGKTVFINKDKKKDENYKILHPMYEQITL